MNRTRIASLKPSTSVKQFLGRVLALAFLGFLVTGVEAAATGLRRMQRSIRKVCSSLLRRLDCVVSVR